MHNEYLRFVRPGAAGKMVRPSWSASSRLGTRIFDDMARIDGKLVGFEANTTPWATMSEKTFARKMTQVGSDYALLREGAVDRVIWFGTEALPSSGMGGQLSRALQNAGIEYWMVPW